MANQELTTWARLNRDGARLRKIEMPDGSFVIGLSGLSAADVEWQKFISVLNFRPSASGRLLLRHGRITLSEIRSVFPNAVTDNNVPFDEVYVMRNKVVDRSVISDTQASIFIGKNYMDQEVFLTATGARYIAGRDGSPVSEESVSIAPAFLRVREHDDIDLCADGFVLQMAGGTYLRSIDIRKFCATIYGDENDGAPGQIIASGETDNRLRGVQESVEAAVFRNISRDFAAHGDIKRSFARACGLLDRQPAFEFRTSQSIELQQYSTPSTLSIAVQNAIGDVDGLEVLEPTIGNASLVSMLRGASITGVEIDDARARRTRKMFVENDTFVESKISIQTGDFTEMEASAGKYDAIVANPPFGGLEKSVVKNGMKVTRIDQLILLQSLESRKDNGKSVFVIAADRENIYKENEGQIMAGGSRNLFNWLADHYEIDAFEVSGDMYRQQGAGYPVRVISIGRRRSLEESVAARKSREFRIDFMPVIKTNEDLWAKSESIKTFLSESVAKAGNAARNSLSPSFSEAAIDASVQPAQQTLPPVAIPVAGNDTSGNEDDAVFGNEYQAQYEPMSRGTTSAMIPRNLAVPQNAAFKNFIEEFGDAEEFVRKELQIEDLQSVAPDAPEQIDAIALAISNMKKGRALILADQTGMGKGRIVAAIARWSALNNHPVIFLTEKASLFSDFYRDIRDIGSENVFTPFILNEDTDILSTDGQSGDKQEVLIQRTSKATRKRVIDGEGGLSDEGFNLMLATYSQFNRNEATSSKARFIKNVSAGATIILDESHNAAGDSNTGMNIAQAVQMSRAAVYSSATYSKNASNMSVYYKAFPTTVDMQSLSDTLLVGGEPLQEVLSAMLCEDGVLVRREHDLSNLKFSTVKISNEMLDRNIRVSDQVSEVLSMMAYLSGDIEKLTRKENAKISQAMKAMNSEVREGKRMGVSYTNFGSRLYNISRQIALSFSMDSVISDAITTLKAGKKPVIVLEQTMESIMSEGYSDGFSTTEEGIEIATAERQITIKSLLTRVLGKLTTITKNNGYGVSEKIDAYSLSEDSDQRRALSDFIDGIQSKIDGIDDMTIMPLDQIRAALSAEGYSCGEVSGRGSTFVLNEDGTVTREERRNDTSNKLSEIFRFNSGDHDAVIITRSGCTGISMHSSAKFADRRQRVLIEAQIANNVAERVQFFGRVNRRGQVSSPEIHSVTSGLPWENRLLAMQNMKMRKLTANVQSNRNSAAEMKGVPDILNAVGEFVCKEFLSSNPEIMTSLGIDPDGAENSTAEFFFANKITGRMSLLPYVEQVRIYEELTGEYHRSLIDLTNKGINPMESKLLDVHASVSNRYELLPGITGGSVFDAPVFAEKIEWVEKINPIRAEKAMEIANKSIKELAGLGHLFEDKPVGMSYLFASRRNTKGLNPINPAKIIEIAKKGFEAAMLRSVPERFYNPDNEMNGVDAALEEKEMNAVKRMNARKDWFVSNVEYLMPGDPITLTINDEETSAVIVSVLPPEQGKEYYLGQWAIKVLPSGAQATISMTYNSLIDDPKFKTMPIGHSEVYSQLDDAPAGDINFSKWTLSGNLFRASEMAARSDIGRAGIYTTKDGGRHRAILCRSSVDLKSLMTTEVAISKPDAQEFLEAVMANKSKGRIPLGEKTELMWNDHGRQMRISTPGTKLHGGQVFLNKNLIEITGEFSGSRTIMSATFDRPRDIGSLINAIYESKCAFTKTLETVRKMSDKSGSSAALQTAQPC